MLTRIHPYSSLGLTEEDLITRGFQYHGNGDNEYIDEYLPKIISEEVDLAVLANGDLLVESSFRIYMRPHSIHCYDGPQKVIIDEITFAEAVKRGSYHHVNDTKNMVGYPQLLAKGVSNKIVEVQICSLHGIYVRFNCTNDLIAALKLEGYRPADPAEFLAVFAQHHSASKRYYMVFCLGAKDDNGKILIMMGENSDEKFRDLSYAKDHERSWHFGFYDIAIALVKF